MKKLNFINKTFILKIKYFFFIILFIVSNNLFSQIISETKIKKTNYSDINNWAAHPWKKDLSDSISEGIKDRRINDSIVDVFFIHPTTYLDKEFIGWNADISDKVINEISCPKLS